MKAGFTHLAKLLAICLALTLLGGYVYWRSENAKQQAAKREAAAKALEAERAKVVEEGAPEDLSERMREVIMSSSKSGPVMMPGSKSFDPVPPNPREEFLQQEEQKFRELVEEARRLKEEKEKAKQRVLLPSPKYAPMDLDPTGLEDLKRLVKPEEEAQQPEPSQQQ